MMRVSFPNRHMGGHCFAPELVILVELKTNGRSAASGAV
jgi:hypothetical protein